MTINQVIKAVDGMKPHGFSSDVLTMWINEIEGMAQTDVMLIGIEELTAYTYDTNADTVLLIHPPHDKVYVYYLCAMIDFANNDYDKYENTMMLFNKFWGDYVRWYAMTYDPANGKAVERGYYLSAYSIAVSHGYKGTEDEWLKSLKGEKGDQGKGWVVNVHAINIDYLNDYSSTHTVYQGMVAAVGAEAPYQYYIYDDIIGWVNHGYLSSEESKIAAENAADEAKGYKDQASGYADEAEGYKDQASGYADEAEGYKEDAFGYADVSITYSEIAKEFAAEAEKHEAKAYEYAETAQKYIEANENYGIRAKVKGVNAVLLKDVSELSHTISITANTGKLSVVSRNLIDYKKVYTDNGTVEIDEENHGFVWNNARYHVLVPCELPAEITVVFDAESDYKYQYSFGDENSETIEKAWYTVGKPAKLAKKAYTLRIRKKNPNTVESNTISFRNIKLELGDTPTPWSEYKEFDDILLNGGAGEFETDGTSEDITLLDVNGTKTDIEAKYIVSVSKIIDRIEKLEAQHVNVTNAIANS